jgi:hypothetical protein
MFGLGEVFDYGWSIVLSVWCPWCVARLAEMWRPDGPMYTLPLEQGIFLPLPSFLYRELYAFHRSETGRHLFIDFGRDIPIFPRSLSFLTVGLSKWHSCRKIPRICISLIGVALFYIDDMIRRFVASNVKAGVGWTSEPLPRTSSMSRPQGKLRVIPHFPFPIQGCHSPRVPNWFISLCRTEFTKNFIKMFIKSSRFDAQCVSSSDPSKTRHFDEASHRH